MEEKQPINKHLSGIGIIAHVSHASVCMDVAMIRAARASEPERGIVIVDGKGGDTVKEQVIKERLPLLAENIVAPKYFEKKRHKPNTGITIGSYKFKTKKKKK